MDGTVKLYHTINKKVLNTFVHSKPDDNTLSKTKDADGNPLPPKPPTDSDTMETEDTEEEVAVLTVECVGISYTDSKWIASGGMDTYLKVWDVTTGQIRSSYQHGDTVTCLKWHKSLPIIATGCLDAIVRLIDARNGNCLKEFSGHLSYIIDLEIYSKSESEEGIVIISVSNDGTSRVFNYNPGTN